MGNVLKVVAVAGFKALLDGFTTEQQQQYNTCKKTMSDYNHAMEESRRHDDIESYDRKKAQMHQSYVNLIGQIPQPPKSQIRSVAVVGATGTGKSSIINAMYGTNCNVSPLVCTKDAEVVYETPQLQVYDVFGTNDLETYNNTDMLLMTKTMHLLVCLYTESVESVLDNAKMLQATGVPILFIRNKCDLIKPDELAATLTTELKTLQSVLPGASLMLASAVTGMGLDRLKTAIAGQALL